MDGTIDQRIQRQLDVLRKYIAENGNDIGTVSSLMALSAVEVIESVLSKNAVNRQTHITDPRQTKPL